MQATHSDRQYLEEVFSGVFRLIECGLRVKQETLSNGCRSAISESDSGASEVRRDGALPPV